MAKEFILTNEQYKTGIIVDEYNGGYSLTAAWQPENGEAKARWCYPEKNRAPVEKAVPVKINLGANAGEACAVLIKALEIIDPNFTMDPAKPQFDGNDPPELPGSDIPF